MRLQEVIEEIRGSIVQVTYTISGLPHDTLDELGADGAVFSRPFGSGLFISDAGHVITAKHVLDEIDNFAIDYSGEGHHIVGVGLAYPNEEGEGVQWRGTFSVIKFDVVATDERNDLALLRLVRNPFLMSEQRRTSSHGQVLQPSAAVLDTTRPRDGTRAAVSGYPLDQAVLVTTAGHVASAWSVDITNQLIPDGAGGYGSTDITDRYLADIQTNAGNSGGPAYRVETGAVIGVLIKPLMTSVIGDSSLQTSANLAQLVPARYVADLATRNGVPIRESNGVSA